MVRFDIESLFTNLPLNDCLDIIAKRLKNMSPDYVDIVKHCLTSGYLMWKDEFYVQVDGVAMGSPVSPIVADIFVEDFEERALANAPVKPRLYKRYVDDTFVVLPNDKISAFLAHLNSIHNNIKYTVEQENKNCQIVVVKIQCSSSSSRSRWNLRLEFDKNNYHIAILGATVERPYITVHNKEIVTLSALLTFHLKTRKGVAKWSHIKDFFEIDNKTPNFVFAPAFTKKCKTKNVRQTSCTSFEPHSGSGLYAKIADGALSTEAAITANVISHMDKLFDALNSDSADLRRGEIFSTNLTAKSPHHKLFQSMKYFLKTLKFMGSLRTPPQEGWIWTINGVERLFKQFANEGIKSRATRRLQQDPLENLFGCIRGNCGSNSNPTVGTYWDHRM
ncbi:unnamed protein product [Pieris macdunnoughi]|uniref:Reverse transcriptase domain-containing protein n=1 Tax=Pieris macdunnoughi TaxID=345717 RepID=A0A821W5I0_9NEOP|nr:unnamed protein product [Pieris macdunnoughi]